MSAAIAGGALLQYPIGWLSDRVDRRKILFLLCFGASVSSAAVALSSLQPWYLLTVFLFGAMVMPLYAMALATAADVSSSDEFVTIGTTVLLLHALGSVSAPLALGPLMGSLGATALFWSFATLCMIFSCYLLLQLREARAVSVAQQTPFEVAASEAAPIGFELDPRGPEHGGQQADEAAAVQNP
jgi:MFS family permease